MLFNLWSFPKYTSKGPGWIVYDSYLKRTVARDTIQVFFNFMLVSKLYQSINCHHLLSIGIDSQFSLIGHH